MQFKHRLLHLILLLPDSELVKYFLVRRNLKVPATMHSNKGTEWVYSKVRMYCSICVIAEASSFSCKRNAKGVRPFKWELYQWVLYSVVYIYECCCFLPKRVHFLNILFYLAKPNTAVTGKRFLLSQRSLHTLSSR